MKKTLMALLLGTALVTVPVRSYAVSAKTQSTLFYVMAGLSLLMETVTMGTAIATQGWPYLGTDVLNAALDTAQLLAYRKRHTHWKGIPKTLQANERKIGGFEEEESYDEEEYRTETDVHAMALTNTGIEAIYDGDEPAKDAVTYSNSGMLAMIQEKFGTPHITSNTQDDGSAEELRNAVAAAARQQVMDSASGAWVSTEEVEAAVADATSDLSRSTGTKALQEALRAGYSEEDKELQAIRRSINHQKAALNGISKAELMQSVVATDNSKARLRELEGFVGGGESLAGQAKIYAGLELELAGRLNMLNSVQGSLLAVEAANALSRVE